MSFYDQYVSLLEAEYPETAKHQPVREQLSPNLVCPHIVELPLAVAEQADAIAEAFFALRERRAYQDFARQRTASEQASIEPGNNSALMCFDFHLLADNQLKLIEINTNGSISLIGDLLYSLHGFKDRWSASFRDVIVDTFRDEYRFSGLERPLRNIAIVDAEPEKQRLFLEFRLFQELFSKHGLSCTIKDPRELRFDTQANRLTTIGADQKPGIPIDLVYNRHTDFYLEHEDTRALRDAWRTHSVCITPNPHEYFLLADKERLQELSALLADDGTALSEQFGLDAEQARILARTILQTVDISSFADPADLWTRRKKLFFKPKQSFGGKGVYRGSSITRSAFEKVIRGDYIAQEFAPPSTLRLPSTENVPGGEFKFDLRFFAYRERIQLAIARLYQGQTTNVQTPGGGAAAIRWR